MNILKNVILCQKLNFGSLLKEYMDPSPLRTVADNFSFAAHFQMTQVPGETAGVDPGALPVSPGLLFSWLHAFFFINQKHVEKYKYWGRSILKR